AEEARPDRGSRARARRRPVACVESRRGLGIHTNSPLTTRLQESGMDRVSDRHEGDLGGRLDPFDASRPAVVRVTVPGDVAASAACQHTAWMLLNLLARADGIVDRIE